LREVCEIFEEHPFCPECGFPLSICTEKDDKTREIRLEFFYEGAGEYEFIFQISTGLTDDDID